MKIPLQGRVTQLIAGGGGSSPPPILLFFQMQEFTKTGISCLRQPFVGQQFLQSFYGAVLNAGEYIRKPPKGIDLPQAACSQQRVDDGRMICRLVAATKEIVLASERQRAHGILRQVVVDAVSAVRHVAG